VTVPCISNVLLAESRGTTTPRSLIQPLLCDCLDALHVTNTEPTRLPRFPVTSVYFRRAVAMETARLLLGSVVAGSAGLMAAARAGLAASPSLSTPSEADSVGTLPSASDAADPLRHPTSPAMQRFVISQCQDEEEAVDMAVDASESRTMHDNVPVRGDPAGQTATDGGRDRPQAGLSRAAGGPSVGEVGIPREALPRATCGNGSYVGTEGIEPRFDFVVVPSADQLKDVSDPFVSQYMMDITSEWPQPTTSRLRKRLNALGKESAGASRGTTRGSNATMKTWSSRIRTACAFANFVGRTVCIDPALSRPIDGEIDRGVQKFFRCLSPYTKLVITTFLECRRRGYPVSGGGRRLSATSLKDYSSGLSFLFAEAKVDGPRGVVPVVVDCCERTSPWQPKGIAELREEEKVRADPGSFTGNPMATADVRDFRGATNKEARHDGETQLSSAPVTESMIQRFFDAMIRSHQTAIDKDGERVSLMSALKDMVASSVFGLSGTTPAGSAAPRSSLPAAARASAAEEPSSDDECDTPSFTPPSNALADFLVYVFYVFAFLTVARPIILINLKFKDINWPDMTVAENQEFFNRCASVSLG